MGLNVEASKELATFANNSSNLMHRIADAVLGSDHAEAYNVQNGLVNEISAMAGDDDYIEVGASRYTKAELLSRIVLIQNVIAAVNNHNPTLPIRDYIRRHVMYA